MTKAAPHLRGLNLRWMLAAVLSLLAVAFGPSAAFADTQHKPYPYGAPGDVGATRDCVTGSYIVGFAVSYGAWFDKLGAVCAELKPDGKGFLNGKQQDMFGGNGGGPVQIYTCAPNEYVSRVFVQATDNAKQVEELQLWCVALAEDTKTRWVTVGSEHKENGHTDLQVCNGGEAASGIELRFGQHVNAFGLHCRPLTVSIGAPVRAPPPPPVMSNAGAPIKQTGRPSTPAPPPPPAVPNLPPESTSPAVSSLPGYAGIWSVTTVQNAQYEMVLRVDGDVLTGEFKNLQNDIYSGTLTGKLVTDRASISWIQPRNLDSAGQPSQGTGTIKVHTDNTLGGGITYQAPGAAQASYYRWYGTLVRALPVVKHPANPAPNPGVDPGANPGANPGARPGPISNPDASPTRRTFTQANVQRGSRVYRSRSGSDQPENAACEVRRGEIVNVDGVGPDKWVHLANIQNRDCNGQAGWVWNDGDLSMR